MNNIIYKQIAVGIVASVIITGCSKQITQKEDNILSNTQLGEEMEYTQTDVSESLTVYDNMLEDVNTESDNSLHLIMVGDVLLHTPIEEGAVQDDGTYDFHHLFEQVKEAVTDADHAIVNQEVILGGSELGVSGYPAFNGPFEVADALYDTGFDVVLHGTNHALDKGEKGILNCLANWRKKYPDMAVLGIHDSLEDSRDIYYTEQKGMKIAILNYTYGTNGISVPSGKDYLVDYLDETKVRADIQTAEANADFTIMCPHWGTEYEHGISSQQEKWTQIFLEEGVDLVIGTHPHVIEPVKCVEDDDHSMLVYYSLGNFINCTSGSGKGTADRMVGGMAEVTLEMDDVTQEVSIKDYGVEPLVTQMAYGQNEITTYFLKDYSQELAKTNKIREKDDSFSYEYCVSLCEDIFQGVWKNKD